MLNRRQFMGSLASAAALLGLPGVSLAQSAADRKFLFVFAEGGWDPLCVFAPIFGSPMIDMETEAALWTHGGFRLVDHPGRPAVRQFFETWSPITTVFNGISTRSIAHDVCTFIAMTGSSSGSESDWPTLIAQARKEDYSLPSLVISGPVLPGNHEVAVARTGDGMLGALTNGDVIDYAAHSMGGPGADAQRVLDRYVSSRAQAYEKTLRTAHARSLARDLDLSLRQSTRLKSLRGTLPMEAYDLDSRVEMAVAALSLGLSRCVVLSDDGGWDTHEDNAPQTPLFQDLFSSLNGLMAKLANTPGTTGAPLLDETVVVVLSEMGRTPKFNGTDGRDHWPYTSAMVIGNAIAGGREIGAYDNSFSGVGVDPRSGELDSNALGVSSLDFGATLLAMADVDPAKHLPGARPIGGILR